MSPSMVSNSRCSLKLNFSFRSRGRFCSAFSAFWGAGAVSAFRLPSQSVQLPT